MCPQLVKRFKPNPTMKSSFDRFGDDLTELIVGYLPIQDKFRLQCLSKRIQSLIFTKQWILKLSIWDKNFTNRLVNETSIANYRQLKYQVFEVILKKLRFVTDIVIDDRIVVNSRVLLIISKHCHHLRRLAIPWTSTQDSDSKLSISTKAIEMFGSKCGKNLRSLALSHNSPMPSISDMKLLLSMTPNLVSLNVMTIHSMFLLEPINGQMRPILPKLKEIKCDFYNEKDLIELQTNYSRQLVKIKANITTFHMNLLEDMTYEMSPQMLHQVLAGFGNFDKLQTLDLWLDFEEGDHYKIWPHLSKVAQECPLLTKLSLCLSAIQIEKYNFLSVLGSFESLTSLQIMIAHDSLLMNDDQNNSYSSLSNLKKLTKLKHLNISYEHLGDNDFANVGKILPQLESLFVWTKKVLSDKTLEQCSQLKALKGLRIQSLHSISSSMTTFNDSGVERLLNGCHHLKSLQLLISTKPMNISHQTIDAFRRRAKQKPKIKFYLALSSANITNYRQIINDLPINMRLDIRSERKLSHNKYLINLEV